MQCYFWPNMFRACIDKIFLLIHLLRILRLAKFYEFAREVPQCARDASVRHNYVFLVSSPLSPSVSPFPCSFRSFLHTPTHNLIPCFHLTK